MNSVGRLAMLDPSIKTWRTLHVPASAALLNSAASAMWHSHLFASLQLSSQNFIHDPSDAVDMFVCMTRHHARKLLAN